MSLLQHSLELFGFSSIDEVTETTLKQAFKASILRSHPDRGGSETDIEKVMNSYVFLAETLQRLSGGRATLQNIVSPGELKGNRADELINRIFEEFDNEAFNIEFEKQHIVDTRGYESWLKNISDETNLTNGTYGSATLKPPTFSDKDLNDVFEKTYKNTHPSQTSIILHPDEMAFSSGKNLGISLIEQSGGTFTSDPSANPEYTDLYSAFTSENTISDKIPSFTTNSKTLDELIAERQKVIQPTEDDLKYIAEYEKKKLAEQKQHMENVKKHFNTDNLQSKYHLEYEKSLENNMNNFIINC